MSILLLFMFYCPSMWHYILIDQSKDHIKAAHESSQLTLILFSYTLFISIL